MPNRQLTSLCIWLALAGTSMAQPPNAAPAPAQGAPVENEPKFAWSLDSLRDAVTPESAPYLAMGLVAILALVIGLILFRIARWLLAITRRRKEVPPPNLEIDVPNLAAANIASATPRLEIYGIPSVVVAVVVAPSGRDAEEPPKRVAFHLLEAVTPGFGEVLAGHQPLLAVWPAQLSTQGFSQIFFTNARLPGDAGKGTEWTSVAGKVQWKGKMFLVGIVFRAEKPLELGQRLMEHVGQWVEMLRVRR
jgi:hypothetical protein